MRWRSRKPVSNTFEVTNEKDNNRILVRPLLLFICLFFDWINPCSLLTFLYKWIKWWNKGIPFLSWFLFKSLVSCKYYTPFVDNSNISSQFILCFWFFLSKIDFLMFILFRFYFKSSYFFVLGIAMLFIQCSKHY